MLPASDVWCDYVCFMRLSKAQNYTHIDVKVKVKAYSIK